MVNRYEVSQGRFRPDRWGSEFVFRRSADKANFALYSIGRNKLDEQEAGDDVVAWPKQYSCTDNGEGVAQKAIIVIHRRESAT